MENWKKQYSKNSRRNWAKEFEEREDEIWKKSLNASIERNKQELQQKLGDRRKLQILEQLVKDFETLILYSFDYNEKDYVFFKEKLEKLRWKILEEDHKESSDYRSWKEYEEEERD